LVNSICLALFDYSDRDSIMTYNRVLETINYACTVIYLLEAFFKIIAMGFVLDENSYMRTGWNIMDFVISLIGYLIFTFKDRYRFLEMIAINVNLKALRILRLIRPLRTLKASQRIRKQVSALLNALPELGNSTLFILFITLLCAITGL